jgi:tritrans,polycis-undecaprenyl-diphosphate synthase [geranylgeranyl-diphosphate specific]
MQGSERPKMLKTLLSITGIYKLYEKWLWYQIKNGKNPEHIAIILDGNRRWAEEHSLPTWLGHREGADKIENLLYWCLDLNVKSITLYSFSTENFLRSPNEVGDIMKIIEEKLTKVLTDELIHKNKVHVRIIGRRGLLPESLQELSKTVEEATKDYNEHFLNIALAYGGRAEIVDVAKKLAHEVEKGNLKPDDIEEKVFEKYLYTAHLPQQDPDIIIRTSGEERLSGFLLWQSAYSELFFLDIYWPDFRQIDLLRAVRTFQKRKRRFGQ